LVWPHQRFTRRIFDEVMNQGRLAVVDELFAPTSITHQASGPGEPAAAGLRQLAASLRQSYPDLRFTVEDQIAEGDKVVTRFTMRGTNRGELLLGPGAPLPATGKAVTISGIVINRIAGGRIVENWVVVDELGNLRQLGLFPAPGAAPVTASPGERTK
jgi:predicted ester cyclase